MSRFNRDDIKKFIRILNECGCEDEDHSIYGNTMYQPQENLDITELVLQNGPGYEPMCPASYQKSVEHFCSNPHQALEQLRPLMQQVGIGCPQSFAQALADMFEVAMETGIVKPFNTDQY